MEEKKKNIWKSIGKMILKLIGKIVCGALQIVVAIIIIMYIATSIDDSENNQDMDNLTNEESINSEYNDLYGACGEPEEDFWDENTSNYIEANQESQENETGNSEKTFTTAEEIAQGTTSYSADTYLNNNSTQQYLDETALQAKGLAKCLDENMNIKSLLNSGDFVHKEEVTKNSDGSVSVHIGLYEKETYEYSQMYGMPIYEVAYDDVTLTKEEATR